MTWCHVLPPLSKSATETTCVPFSIATPLPSLTVKRILAGLTLFHMSLTPVRPDHLGSLYVDSPSVISGQQMKMSLSFWNKA